MNIIQPNQSFVPEVKGNLLHVVAEFKVGDAHRFGLNINGHKMTYNHLRGNFNGTHYKVPYDDKLKIEVVVDRSSMEIFVNDGELY
jgi:sucrose-6-phosphate hydrolase SacC (GH32 family)